MYILVDVSHPLTGVTVDAYAVLQHSDIAVIANKNLYVYIMVPPYIMHSHAPSPVLFITEKHCPVVGAHVPYSVW